MVTYKFPGDKEKNGGPISNSLLSKLQKDILTGKLKAGQKLTEQELCREYEVSRTPVREELCVSWKLTALWKRYLKPRSLRDRHERAGL